MKRLSLVILSFMFSTGAYSASQWHLCEARVGGKCTKFSPGSDGKKTCKQKIEDTIEKEGKAIFSSSNDQNKYYDKHYCKEVLNEDQWMKYTIFFQSGRLFKTNDSSTSYKHCYNLKNSSDMITGKQCAKFVTLSKGTKMYVGSDNEISNSEIKKVVFLDAPGQCKTNDHLGKACRGKISEAEAKRHRKGDFAMQTHNGTEGTSSDDVLIEGVCRPVEGKGFKCTVSKGDVREQFKKKQKMVEGKGGKWEAGNKIYDAMTLTWQDVYFLIEGEK